MATYSGARSQHQTLTANTVDTVTLNADFDEVEVLNRDTTSLIYFTADGSTPTVSGAGTYVVPAGGSLKVAVPTSGNSVVKLISAGAAAYSVTGV